MEPKHCTTGREWWPEGIRSQKWSHLPRKPG